MRKTNLQKELNLSLKYLKESKSYVKIVSIIFGILFLLGFIFPFVAPDSLRDFIIEMVKVWIEDLIDKTEGKNFLQLWAFIFLNNAAIGFVSIFSGFLLGIIPGFLIFSNAFGIGMIVGVIALLTNSGFGVLLRLVPHGIFEIPAILISFGIGIKAGSFIFYKSPKKTFRKFFINSLRVFVFIIVPLLFLASFIETILIVFLS